MIPDRTHYRDGYLSRERWLSYVAQVEAVRDVAPASVAEIGVGPGVVRHMVEATYPGCRYISVDIAPDLRPDVCASVLDLPFRDDAVDATFCCQVLEHLPYERFVPALRELGRISRRRVVVSLPDVRPFFFLRLRYSRRLLAPLWRGISLPHPWPRRHNFEQHGQHHWEIGKRDHPVSRILADMGEAGLILRNHVRMVERPYWHFFILDVGP